MTATAPQVLMNRSRPYATIHGERVAGDRHANVHFQQNGLPFDSRGVLIPDHPDVLENPALKAKAEKLLKDAPKVKVKAPGDSADADNAGDGDGEPAPVVLRDWAAGTDFPWLEVSQAIARRFAKRVNSKRDALELLVAEGVIQIEELSAPNQKLLRAD